MATFRPDQENSVYIGQGAQLTGELRADDIIVVDGAFDGEIFCNHLIVGPTGVVKGKIIVSSAEISGQVSAEITAKQLMSVRATGRVEGSWDCGAIEVARGAVLNGSANVAETTGAKPREVPAPRRIEPPMIEEEHDERDAVAAIAAPLGARRLTKLNLRVPRRSVG
ncbi:polymer-forming cytoskeletal protein [Methylocystis echinoides]|uniref:bactofilin family protein n=1 Tax=Methylocystis echinoides TaxID=29468 RepID=UPI003419122A